MSLLGAQDPPADIGGGLAGIGERIVRTLVRIEPIASASADELVARFGPIIQHCLAGTPASGPLA
ncbi:MAG: hypothetical protein ABW224_07610 [Kibdelosporangium sp.]